MKYCCLYQMLCCVGAAVAFPQFPVVNPAAAAFQAPPPGQVQFGVDARGCLVGPSGSVCPTGNVQFTDGAHGVPQPVQPSFHSAPVHHTPVAPVHHPVPPTHQFVGLVGPSGVIGPSGLVGPSGPVAFHG